MSSWIKSNLIIFVENLNYFFLSILPKKEAQSFEKWKQKRYTLQKNRTSVISGLEENNKLQGAFIQC